MEERQQITTAGGVFPRFSADSRQVFYRTGGRTGRRCHSGRLRVAVSPRRRNPVVTKLDPLTYGVDGLRGAFIGVSHFGMMTDAAVLFGVAWIFFALGAWYFSKIQV
jgi:hypothetical protein